MAVDFFSKEVERVQKNFNSAYKGLVVINLRQRERIIMAIIHMGLLTRSVKKAETDFDRTFIIKKFIRIRNAVNRQLSLIRKERSCHGNNASNGHQGSANDGSSTARRNSNHLQAVR